jgi:hypothetical protein
MPNYIPDQTRKGGRQTARISMLMGNQHINAFSGGGVTDHAGEIINGIAEAYNNEKDRLYVTQRPSIRIEDTGSDNVTIYYDTRAVAGFAAAETITGDDNGATGTIITVVEQASSTVGVITLSGVVGTFVDTESITSSGGGTAEITAVYTNDSGRGIYYWDAVSSHYLVADGAIYMGGFDSPVAVWENVDNVRTLLVNGHSRVEFVTWISANTEYLFIINPEDNQMFIIDKNDPDMAVNAKDLIDDSGLGLTDDGSGVGYPLNTSDGYDFTLLPVTSSLGGTYNLSRGAVVLDSYLFLGEKDEAQIYNSAVDNFLVWNATEGGIITAERSNDKLLSIVKTRDHVGAIGERTIEFYYDAGNVTGSPLTPRQDISYNVGAISDDVVFENGDEVYFLGISPRGNTSLYLIKDFTLAPISWTTIDSFFRQTRIQDTNINYVVSGFSLGGHTYILVTPMNATTNTPDFYDTFVYDATTQFWYDWYTPFAAKGFPVIDVDVRTKEEAEVTRGIMYNAQMFSMSDDFSPVDTNSFIGYFAGDYELEDYDTEDGASFYSIDLTVEIDNLEFGTTDSKRMHSLDYVGSTTTVPQLLEVTWEDDGKGVVDSGEIDLSYRSTINRMGSFNRRKFSFKYSGDEQIRFEGVEVTYSLGGSR